MGIQTPMTIAKAIENIQFNHYVLPAIQREFVWDSEQIQRLFDSLMRGYPIGLFLFWGVKPGNLQDFEFYRFMDHYHERDCRHNEPIPLVGEKPVIAVLDGQQRLTALNIGLKGWYADKLPYYRWSSDHAYPKRRLYLNIMAPPEEGSDYAFEFRMLKEQEAAQRDERHYWFPVGDILQFKGLPEVYGYCVDNDILNKQLKYPSSTLVELWNVITQKEVISYFLEEAQDLDKVLNIFIRVNSGGTELSYSDMLLSIAVAQWKDRDAREEIYDLIDNLNRIGESFDFSKDFVLKATLVLTDIPTIEFKVKNFNRENMLVIERKWEEIARALKVTTRLLASWGYNRDTLVANNAIIPLSYYIFRKGSPLDFVSSPRCAQDREVMREWLMRALLKRTFGGQSDNVLRRIRQVMSNDCDSFPLQGIYDALSATAKSMSFDNAQLNGLLDYRYGQAYTFTVLAFLYPWLKFDQHFHVDHIFPRGMFTPKTLRDRRIPKDQWHKWLDHKDDLANLQLLQGLVNQNKADKEFEAWLASSQPTEMGLKAYKEQHLIPDIDLSFENFPEFLEARAQKIKERLGELVGSKSEESGIG